MNDYGFIKLHVKDIKETEEKITKLDITAAGSFTQILELLYRIKYALSHILKELDAREDNSRKELIYYLDKFMKNEEKIKYYKERREVAINLTNLDIPKDVTSDFIQIYAAQSLAFEMETKVLK